MVLFEKHGMIEELIESFFTSILKVEEGTPLCEFFTHFTYDLIRTFLVFIVVLLLVSYLQTYISARHIRNLILNVNRWVAVCIAVIVGLFSSTCVCTNVPLFLGFLALGVPLHLSMTYLISSSLINIASITSMFAIDGFKFSMFFLATSVLTSLVAGIILTFIGDKGYLYGNLKQEDKEFNKSRKKDRIKTAVHRLKHNIKEQWVWILLGVLLAAVIDSIVDVNFAQRMSSLGIWGVLATTSIGVVLHTDIIAIIPVLSAFLDLKMNFGILFSLTASLSFFSFPMIVMLKKTVKFKYLMIVWVIMYVLLIIAGAILLPFTN